MNKQTHKISLILSFVSIAVLLVVLSLPPTLRTAAQSEDTPLGEIVFASDRDGDYDIYVMNSDGSDVRQLTNNDAYDGYPVWSPDGSKIAFLSSRDNRDNQWSLYVMDADGSNV